ncbi:hypothetical protein UFOVP558_65 [uncultured Caudovirales phage]|uniref:Uncharacterized protein n=1 Tax=uncultured Caudovirales phage TaxID=2100421 RepID=A0A6J5MW09_9CAUD|nr:hypothetical protein UFOVP558_65 [uncultured Caudovirales phage]
MPAPKKITDFLKPEPPKETAPVQGYVPRSLRDDVLKQMKTDKDAGTKITWDSFLEAACRAYLAERGA